MTTEPQEPRLCNAGNPNSMFVDHPTPCAKTEGHSGEHMSRWGTYWPAAPVAQKPRMVQVSSDAACPACGHVWNRHTFDGCRTALTSVQVCPCMAVAASDYPVAQEPPAPIDDYVSMQRGWAPDDCRCVMTRPATYGGYDGPQPAEWEQADDCPVHPLPVPGGGQEPPAPRQQRPRDGYHCPDCGYAHWPYESHGSNPRDSAPGGAQEPADPPHVTFGADSLRAEIERELREKIARQIEHATNFEDQDNWPWFEKCAAIVRGQS